MKLKSLAFLAAAVACGLVAMLGVQQMMSDNEGAVVETIDVLVATTDIHTGSKLDETNSQFQSFPKDSCPEGAITSREECADRSLKIRAVPGQTIMMAHLSAPGEIGVAAGIPKGMRVVTVPVTATTSHSGQILPGHRVDVVCNYRSRGNSGSSTRTRVILQFVKVFAADTLRDASNSDTQEVQSKNVSLLVTPQQANILLQANSIGSLFLTLRSTNDDEDVQSVTMDDQRFEGLNNSITRDEEDPLAVSDTPTPKASEKKASVKDQLMAEMNTVNTDRETEQAPEPAEEKWTITIYDGDKVRNEQVRMPTVPEAEATTPAEPAQLDRTTLKGFIQSYFTGA